MDTCKCECASQLPSRKKLSGNEMPQCLKSLFWKSTSRFEINSGGYKFAVRTFTQPSTTQITFFFQKRSWKFLVSNAACIASSSSVEINQPKLFWNQGYMMRNFIPPSDLMWKLKSALSTNLVQISFVSFPLIFFWQEITYDHSSAVQLKITIN